MNTCDGCKFWSEMIARCEGGSPVVAMCLNKESEKYRKYVYLCCKNMKEGIPIDMPGYMEEK